jgi:hypothetical protein
MEAIMNEPNSITLHLTDIHDFFTAPDYDPFDVQRLDVSGIDYIVEHLREHESQQPIKTTLYLPKAAITLDLVDKTRQALTRYCQRQIAQNESEIAATRREGRRTLPYALAVALILALVMIALINLLNLSSPIVSILSSVYVIISWVSIWWPAENILYDWIPDWHEKRIYQKIMDMDLSILPEAGNQSP